MSYFNTLQSLIIDKTIENEDLNKEGAFTEICSEYLQESFLINEFQHAYFFKEEANSQNQKINGFCINESNDVLSLFITDFNSLTDSLNLNLKNVEILFKQLYRILNYSIRFKNDVIPKANILSRLHEEFVLHLSDNLLQINFYLLTNNIAVNRKEIKKDSILSKTDLNSQLDFNFRIIDIIELERLHKNNQKLNIEVSDFYDKPINIITPKINNVGYGTALAIFPGEFLFNIYNYFGSSLLASNVRSYLSNKVKVNKGIEETLISKPTMFLAYNNGLCVTVSNIKKNDDGTVKTFEDFQIVNGGQTTSSIYFCKKQNKNVQLDAVSVMAKITEIKRNIDSKEIQKNIARNSNLQNAVKDSDLSSNEEFLINLHAYSRKLKNTLTNNYFYFQRSRGQYGLERDLSKNEKQFLTIYPKENVFDKDILSILYFCAIKRDITPYISVQSAEKRYPLLKTKMDTENKLLSDEYFIRIVGSLILYRNFNRLYGKGANAIGRIAKNVLAYSISLIQFELLKSNNTIDFSNIWNRGLNQEKLPQFKVFLEYVNKLLLENFTDGRLDESCKKEESWKIILRKVDQKNIEKVITCLPIINYKNIKYTNHKQESDSDKKFELMINEINLRIPDSTKFNLLMNRIKDEINIHKEDGMSLYSRSHGELIKSHFRPNSKMSSINAYTYNLYLMECQNSKGEVIKKKIGAMHEKIRELYRVFSAIMEDELLNL
jgi:hypothetical protein